MDELDYSKDDFADIIAKDDRYHPRAYTLLVDVVAFLTEQKKAHVSGGEVLEEFRDRALDLFGPLTYRVLEEWGVKRCEDVGEMMFNLTESRRIAKSEDDTPEDFTGGYDFGEAFLGPFAVN